MGRSMGVPIKRQRVSSSLRFDEACRQLAAATEPERFIDWYSGESLQGVVTDDGAFSVVAVPAQPGFRPRLVGKIVPSPSGCEIEMAVRFGFVNLMAAIVLVGLAATLVVTSGTERWLGAAVVAIPLLLGIRAVGLVRTTRQRVLAIFAVDTAPRGSTATNSTGQ